jgi:cellobiose phosphorylase
MDPCIPKNWPGYAIRYKYIDTTYNINVRNPKGLNKAREGTEIKLVNDGKVHDIEVVMG